TPAGPAKEVALAAGAWQEVDLALPELPQGGAAGWFLAEEGAGALEVRAAVIGRPGKVALEPVDYQIFRGAGAVTLRGRAADGIDQVQIEVTTDARDGGENVGSFPAPVQGGAFSLTLKREQLRPYCAHVFTAVAGAGADGRSAPARAFVYPVAKGAKLPPVTVENGRLTRDGQPFAFVGLNYTHFQMPLARNADYELLARSVRSLRDWKIGFVRVTLTLAMFQPAEGVFPGDPEYAKVLARHQVNQEYLKMFDLFLDLLADNGIYAVMDWHEVPTDPYRYFTGGDPADPERKKPGTAIAWLCGDDRTRGVDWDLSNPRHLKALTSTHAWLAKHLAGKTNVVGFEVPYNEPHRQWESNQANWTRVTTAAALAVKSGCPRMLTFTQNPNFAHNTEGWAFTWLDPAGVDGQAPHHYIANGPVATRPDAPKRAQPWLARDPGRTFAVSIPSLYFPSMVWAHPLYNGEGGEHGAESFLPDMERQQAEEYMYEASLAQCYAAGLAGHVNWTMLDADLNFAIYPKHAPRYAKVMAAGPVDWSRAEVAVIQNSEALPSGNGHNYACVPFVDLALGLHLGPVHYLTDDYLIFNGLSRRSLGLEQASDSAIDFGAYKALVVDQRNLDARIARLLKDCKVPVLMVEDMGKLRAAELAAFLRKAGVAVDDKTPFGLQIAVGPRHVVLYRRAGEGGKSRVYPRVRRDGAFKLRDEQGRAVFSGTAGELAEKGVEISLDKWRSLILEIQ
ncbi:MAG: cellulase family glycosylhydrolase, partial [Planctomycetes bacterium]|nr:cellulase family glycosylhydrolase [Planctomycetota bacterium]